MSEVDKFINMLSADKPLALDTETNGLKWSKCGVCGYGVSDGIDVAYVPVRHGGGDNINDPVAFERSVGQIISKRKTPLTLQNAKFDKHMCYNHGIEINNTKDTMVAGALLNENQFSFSLANLCKNYPDIPQKKGKDLYEYLAGLFSGKPDAKQMGNYFKLSGTDNLGVEYACGDNISTFLLSEKQKDQLSIQGLDKLFELENKLTHVLFKMERKGIKVDLERFEAVKKQITELHLEAYRNIPIGEDFEVINVKSSKDLKKYFEWCGINEWPLNAPTDRFPEGSPSFNKRFLKTINEGLVILEARKYDHLISSFIEPLPNHIHNGRIHCNFNQTAGEYGGAKSGRLSSYEPNMQQIPKRDKFTGKIFRSMFVPDNDFIFVEFDYSQCEPRLFTHYSHEPTLIAGYNSIPYIDMHMVAAQYMNISRDIAKNLNLGMMYVMGYPSLAGHLNIDVSEAKYMSQRWHRTFPEVSKFTKAAAKRAEARGFVRTILGRRARFPDPRWSYRAANRIVQGGSADILKYKMVELDQWLTDNNYHDVCQMLLNIHDAILFQVHKDHMHLLNDIERIMCDVRGEPFNLEVPFAVEYKQGVTWTEASYGTH